MRKPSLKGEAPKELLELLPKYNVMNPITYWGCIDEIKFCRDCPVVDAYRDIGCDTAMLLDMLIQAYELGAKAESTCRYLPETLHSFFDENDIEHETNEATDECYFYYCSQCLNTMVGGTGGWFIEKEGKYGGIEYQPMFRYCPECGARVLENEFWEKELK